MDEKASEKAVVFSVRFTLPELEALQEYADRRGSLISTAIRETMLGVVGASTAPCPEWCDGPECDHPPRVGGACAPCAKQHAAIHAEASAVAAVLAAAFAYADSTEAPSDTPHEDALLDAVNAYHEASRTPQDAEGGGRS